MVAVGGTDDCEDDTAVADAAAHEEESDVGVEGQGQSLGANDSSSNIIRKTWIFIMDIMNYFPVILALKMLQQKS
jgi:hypothetical protein